jgi:hypothetical protein
MSLSEKMNHLEGSKVDIRCLCVSEMCREQAAIIVPEPDNSNKLASQKSDASLLCSWSSWKSY